MAFSPGGGLGSRLPCFALVATGRVVLSVAGVPAMLACCLLAAAAG